MLKNKRLLFIENVILCSILLMSILISMITIDYSVIAVSSLVILVCVVMVIHRAGYSYISFPVMFVIISFIFHMGNIVFSVFFFNGKFGDMFWGADEYTLSACRFVILSMCFLLLGIIHKSRVKVRFGKKYDIVISEQQLFFIGIILIAVGIVPKLMIDINKLVVGLTDGYMATYKIDMSGKGGIATLTYTGIISVMIAKRKSINFCRGLLFLTVIYEGIMMFSGNRYLSISMIITICFVYIKYVGDVNWKKLFLYGILAVFLFAVLNTVRELRTSAINISIFIEEFFVQLKDNPFISLIMELGSTMKSLVLSVKYFPQYKDYAYGMTYWEALLNTIPKLSNTSLVDINNLIFIYNFPYHKSLGGSYLGEIYYNFGKMGVVFSYLLGIFIGKIGQIIEDEDCTNKVIFTIPILFYSLSYIRGYVYSYNIAVYHIIAILILHFFVKKIKR